VHSAGLAIGAEGTPSLGAMCIDRLGAAPRFDLGEAKPLGADVQSIWRRKA
jgi:diaminohydroxyphosphoribosylaminopyrimidine deaminase/5-amino-6-(5-phosphoribosylamino)uracil reductase